MSDETREVLESAAITIGGAAFMLGLVLLIHVGGI